MKPPHVSHTSSYRWRRCFDVCGVFAVLKSILDDFSPHRIVALEVLHHSATDNALGRRPPWTNTSGRTVTDLRIESQRDSHQSRSAFFFIIFLYARVVNLWNNLPTDRIDFSSLSKFKKSLTSIDLFAPSHWIFLRFLYIVYRLCFHVVCFYTRFWAAVCAICSLARPLKSTYTNACCLNVLWTNIWWWSSAIVLKSPK